MYSFSLCNLLEPPGRDLRLLDLDIEGSGVNTTSRGGVKRSGGGSYGGITVGVVERRRGVCWPLVGDSTSGI